MESVPMQKSRIAVESPCPSPLPPFFIYKALKFTVDVKACADNAAERELTMNKTGN